MKQSSIPTQGRVYEEFKRFRQKYEFGTIRELCADLLKYAGYYTDIVSKKSSSHVIQALYKDIVDLKMEVSYPFLIKVRNDFENGKISEQNFVEILRLCISYVFRRSICNLPAQSLSKIFVKMIKTIRTDDYLNSIKAFFVLGEGNMEFPDDNKFVDYFIIKDVYNMRSSNFILTHLEEFDNKYVGLKNLTIEHIMPQNKDLNSKWQLMLGENWKEIQKKWVHTIGNLTFTAYNAEMSDRSFEEKKEMKGGFKESPLHLNSSFLNKQSTWTEETIKERGRLLAEQAKKIWEFPALTDAELDPYVKKNPTQYSLDTYKLNDTNKELFQILDRHIQNLSPEVKREFNKKYVSYKLDSNFADITLLKQWLRIHVKMKFSEVNDPNGICRDVSKVGHWGNGDVEVTMKDCSDVDQVMAIIEQAFRLADD